MNALGAKRQVAVFGALGAKRRGGAEEGSNALGAYGGLRGSSSAKRDGQLGAKRRVARNDRYARSAERPLGAKRLGQATAWGRVEVAMAQCARR